MAMAREELIQFLDELVELASEENKARKRNHQIEFLEYQEIKYVIFYIF